MYLASWPGQHKGARVWVRVRPIGRTRTRTLTKSSGPAPAPLKVRARTLTKSPGPEIASMMVMCNKNHGALFEKIKGKILARYKEKYRKTAGAFDTPDDNFDNDDE